MSTLPPPQMQFTKPKEAGTSKFVKRSVIAACSLVALILAYMVGVVEGRYEGREAATDCAAARSYDDLTAEARDVQLMIEFAQEVARDAAPYCFGGRMDYP